MRPVLALVAVLALTAGCSGGDDVDPDEVFERTCALVRSGVAAFNEQQYDTTVDAFRDALEPARELDEVRDDADSAALLEAVEYYAALPAGDYRRAFETSEEFAEHQRTTLGQCGEAGPEDAPGDETQA